MTAPNRTVPRRDYSSIFLKTYHQTNLQIGCREKLLQTYTKNFPFYSPPIKKAPEPFHRNAPPEAPCFSYGEEGGAPLLKKFEFILIVSYNTNTAYAKN